MAIIAARRRRIRRGGGLTPTSPAISGAVSQVGRKPTARRPTGTGQPAQLREAAQLREVAATPSPVVSAPVAARQRQSMAARKPVAAPRSRPTPRVPPGVIGGLAPRPETGGFGGLGTTLIGSRPSPEALAMAEKKSKGVPGNTFYESKLLSEKELK